MAFTSDQLLLSPDKAAQLTKALATLGVADPLQYLCDEAANEVARYTAGYVIDDTSLRQWTRNVALYRAYSLAGPVPADVVRDHDDTITELQAIAAGERPNLPKVAAPAAAPIVGNWGSGSPVPGRMS